MGDSLGWAVTGGCPGTREARRGDRDSGPEHELIYTYDKQFGDGPRWAQALVDTCEDDFARCRAMFGVSGGFARQQDRAD
ncbi:hypothetical protein IQ64_10750 [Streptomyces stelliscabiei]|nr:hypothetical protein IQ64_10750 [Streptomyces stelliscabiei]